MLNLLGKRLNPNIHNSKTAHRPAMGILTAAICSSIVVLILDQLAVLNVGLRQLLQQIGAFFVPIAQNNDPVQGYLGAASGIFVCYFLVFLFWWLLDLRIPGLTPDRLPRFVAIGFVIHALLAWRLCFPWLPLS